jgi:hypothetical protein
MFQNFDVELIPRTTGNGYQNMQIVIFKRECAITVCKAYAVQLLLLMSK